MRALPLLLAVVAGLSSLGLLGVAQLIWAASEASYYVQLAFAVGLLGGLYLLAQKASPRALSIAIVAAAFLAAIMPIERSVFEILSIGRQNAGEPQVGEAIGPASGISDVLTSIGVLWLLYGVLLAAFAFGLRNVSSGTSHASE